MIIKLNTYYKTLIWAICFAIVGLIIAVLPSVKEGLEWLFLLPISMSLSCIVFGDVFSKWNSNIGSIIIFASCLLRYVISPLLMALSHHADVYINTSANDYRMAIFSMIFELLSFLVIFRVIMKKHDRNSKSKVPGLAVDVSQDGFKVTWLGGILCILIMLMLVQRGNLANVFSHFSFFTNYSEDTSAIYTYDRTFVYLLKGFLFCVIATMLRNIANRNKSLTNLCFVCAVIIAIMNIILYDHTSRSVLVEIIISSVAVLTYCFPRKKKFLIISFSIAGFFLVSTVFMFGTLQATWGTISSSSSLFQRIAEVSELYSNGVSTVAQAISTYSMAGELLTVGSFFSGILQSIGFITFPGLRSIYYAIIDIPTASSIFMMTLQGRGFILPPLGLALYYGGTVFAIPISWISTIICVKTLYLIESFRYKTQMNACKIYIITYAEIICGMSIFINNISIMTQTLTSIPLLLFVLLIINSIGNQVTIKLSKETLKKGLLYNIFSRVFRKHYN